jgi:glycosyltransferase involved in cell wall biosynthesis
VTFGEAAPQRSDSSSNGTRPAGPARILVCIPTYDERDNLPGTLRRLRAAVPEADVLVIDDNSPDGTGQIADELAAADPGVHVLHRAGKAGLGAAYVAGFAWGLERAYDVLVEMDADGSHTPEELPRLLSALHRADVVLGSRWMPGGEVRNWPRSRLVLSRGGNAYVRGALGMPLTDATGGFRAYRASVIRSLALETVASQGYCFQVDLVWQAWQRGHRVVEVPITFVERERGRSKMSRDIVAEALWRVTWWGLRSRRGRSVRRSRQVRDGRHVEMPAAPPLPDAARPERPSVQASRGSDPGSRAGSGALAGVDPVEEPTPTSRR